MYVMVHNIDL
uniref:Uncharacterized protein n=1 Tax=Moniliophthora roreri TaxID=221103 RepID=A0A0W0F5S9_MONRR